MLNYLKIKFAREYPYFISKVLFYAQKAALLKKYGVFSEIFGRPLEVFTKSVRFTQINISF